MLISCRATGSGRISHRGYGRAGLKEEILERPGRKRKNATLIPALPAWLTWTTDLPDNPNATGRKVWWSGDRERAGLNEEMSERPWVKSVRRLPRLCLHG
jgi:hypothetical protein